MFRIILVCNFFALVLSSPIKKYPFVFLLDIGNEELKKINTEQIRISVPGGSFALRYPAVGAGGTIGHVRVTGVDFGSDLKANVVDGGPGYEYVILAFNGNKDVEYDVVISLQMIDESNPDEEGTSDDDSEENSEGEEVIDDDYKDIEVKKPPNLNNHDIGYKNTKMKSYSKKMKSEIKEISSKMYNYRPNEVEYEDYSDDGDDNDDSDDDDSNSDDDNDDDDSDNDYSNNEDNDAEKNDDEITYSQRTYTPNTNNEQPNRIQEDSDAQNTENNAQQNNDYYRQPNQNLYIVHRNGQNTAQDDNDDSFDDDSSTVDIKPQITAFDEAFPEPYINEVYQPGDNKIQGVGNPNLNLYPKYNAL